MCNILDSFPNTDRERWITPVWKMLESGKTVYRQAVPQRGWLAASEPYEDPQFGRTSWVFSDTEVVVDGPRAVWSYKMGRRVPLLGCVCQAFAIDVLGYSSQDVLTDEGGTNESVASTLLFIPVLGPSEVTEALRRVATRLYERSSGHDFAMALSHALADISCSRNVVPERVWRILFSLPAVRVYPGNELRNAS